MDEKSKENGVAYTPDTMEVLLREIARALVDDPDSVEVKAVEHDESTVLRLQVSEADIGKVIGKQGRTAHSLRTILSAISTKYHHRYSLDIVKSGGDLLAPQTRSAPAPNDPQPGTAPHR